MRRTKAEQENLDRAYELFSAYEKDKSEENKAALIAFAEEQDKKEIGILRRTGMLNTVVVKPYWGNKGWIVCSKKDASKVLLGRM